MLSFALGFVVALVATMMVLPVLRRLQAIDVPNDRSSHAMPVPRGAGLAVMVAVCGAVIATGGGGSWPLLIIAGALAAIGFVDDLTSLGGSLRLTVQLAAGAGVAGWLWASEMEVAAPAWIAALVVTIGVAGYVNAFNFMDGINGISSLNAAVAGGWYAWVGHRSGEQDLAILGLAVAGACLGFLPWNAPTARVFLGDVGSYGLGALIVGMAAVAWASGTSALLCVAPLCIYAADTAWVLIKRAVGGRPLMQPHREHVYQRLVDSGWSHFASASLTAGAAAVVCGAVWNVPALVAAAALAAILAAYLGAPRVLLRAGVKA